MKQLITEHKDVDLVLPRRHQPHNSRVTSTSNIELSIQNLVELCDQFHYLKVTETKKQLYHSQAVAILMKSPQEGGCHFSDTPLPTLLSWTYSYCGILLGRIGRDRNSGLSCGSLPIVILGRKSRAVPIVLCCCE
jgi:hypothetical protein